ncbi:hypothetical protein GCM10010124_16830 [Pilimelia terevasa]|uniref:Uncharacterized protein n=2 Tax=Pilimelia terevasa TaxID=53372 RepID=A0A8J3BME3_9ACTN|nr:hypothetical protein GCM10010124_16830 [Pilimelia terevasa]
MLTFGDVLMLDARQYRDVQGSIMVEILAVGDLRADEDGYWLPVKCNHMTPDGRAEVRFIEIKSASVPHARSRAAASM